MPYQLPFSNVLVPMHILLYHLLEICRDEAVDDEHLETKLLAQLSDVLQETFHLALVLLLKISNLKRKEEEYS